MSVSGTYKNFGSDSGEVDPGAQVRATLAGVLIRTLETDTSPVNRIAAAEGLASGGDAASAAALRKALADSDAGVRLAALTSLSGEWKDGDAGLLACLNDQNSAVRAAALEAISEITPFSLAPLVPRLIALSRDSSGTVSGLAVRLLFMAELPEASAGAWRSLAETPSLFTMAAAEKAFGVDQPEGVEFLTGAANSSNGELAAAALSAIKATQFPGKRHLLLGALRHGDASVRQAAAADLQDEAGEEVTEALIHCWSRSQEENAGLAEEIVRSLAGREGRQVEAILLQALNSEDDGTAYAAWLALESRQGLESGPAPAQALARFFRNYVPGIASGSSMESWLTVDLEPFMGSSSSRLSYSRRWSPNEAKLVRALARREGEAIVRCLMAALDHPDVNVRCGAALSLSGHSSDLVRCRLEKALQSDVNAVRRCAVCALKGHIEGGAGTTLVSLLASPSEDDDPVLREVVSVLKSRPFKHFAAALQAAWPAGSDVLRRRILKVIEGKEDQGALDLLSRASEDSSAEVRIAALRAWEDSEPRRGLMVWLRALEAVDRGIAEEAASLIIRSYRHSARRLLRWWVSRVLREGTARFSLNRLCVIERMVSELRHDLPRGLDLAILITRLMSQPEVAGDQAIAEKAYSILRQMPQGWQTVTFGMGFAASAGSGENFSVHLIDPEVRAVAALPMILAGFAASQKNQPLGAVRVSEIFERRTEQEIADSLSLLIQFHGRTVLPLLRRLGSQSHLPEAIRCGAFLALGAASDQSSARFLVEQLNSPSEALRSAAMRALIELGDLARADLAVAAAAQARNAKIVARYILAVLGGAEPPNLPDLVNRTLLDHQIAPSETEDSMLRMSTRAHMRELLVRYSAALSVMIIAGLAAGFAIGDRAPSLIAWIYGIPLPAATAYLSAAPAAGWWFGILVSVWCGLPALVHQGWQFAAAGLYSSERSLASRPIIFAGCLTICLPGLLPVIARVLPRLIPSGSHMHDSFALIRMTDAIAVSIALLLLWVAGFRKIWTWLNLLAQSTYIGSVVSGQSGTQPNRISPRRLMLLLATGSVMVCSALPLYWTASLLAGAIAGITLVIARVVLIIDYARSEALDRLGRSFGWALMQSLFPNRWTPVAGLLALMAVFALPELAADLLSNCHLNNAAHLIRTMHSAGSVYAGYRIMSLAAWITIVLANIMELSWALVSSWAAADQALQPAAFLGRFTASGILLASGLGPADSVFSHYQAGLVIVPLTGLSFASLLIERVPFQPSSLLLFWSVLLAFCVLPSPLLSSAVLWTVPLGLACIPAIIDLSRTLPGGIWKTWGALTDEMTDSLAREARNL